MRRKRVLTVTTSPASDISIGASAPRTLASSRRCLLNLHYMELVQDQPDYYQLVKQRASNETGRRLSLPAGPPYLVVKGAGQELATGRLLLAVI